ncbi:hypothetical protein D1X48_06755 [Salmonella enterica]|nr:hypothetical protein [Salmonella enterica]
MNDWRSAPRRGKARFMKHLDEIKQRLRDGYTNREIYHDLTNKGLALSEAQFNRYIRRFLADPAARED